MTFKNHSLEHKIKNPNGNYEMLSVLVSKAINSKPLDLTRSCKANREKLVEKGHLSAYNPFYTARQKDIEVEQLKFRQIFQALMHKSGVL